MNKLLLNKYIRHIAAIPFLFYASVTYAYIDPGTGSALLYVVSGVVVSAYFGIRGVYHRLVELFFRVRFKYQNCEIAIHSEDPRYEITFLPIIEQLVQIGADITYFTMYERDNSFSALPLGVLHTSIPPGMVGYAYLNNLKAIVLVTTTVQLDVMTFRRSKHIRHYTIVQHAIGESRYVRPFAYDYYDSICCCGPIFKENIEKMESIRKLPKKILHQTGIPHYESLIKYAKDAPKPGLRPTVLISPSWGPLSMFETIGTDFIKKISENFDVIVRPHPQMKISQPELYKNILELSGVVVDTSRTPSEAMSKAHIMLSDISGITQEFAFIYERPVLVVDQSQCEGGLEGEVLGPGKTLKQCCSEFIVPFPPAEIDTVVDKIRYLLMTYSTKEIKIKKNLLIYNFDKGAKVAAQQIYKIYSCELKKIKLVPKRDLYHTAKHFFYAFFSN